MTNVLPSMCLKIKKGTFYMPEPNGSVYFRNPSGSFRMEGRTIHQWIEKLIPMFNGEYSLASLTEGLSQPYRDRVYEITEALFTNGFLRDVSQDRPHHLIQQVVDHFSPQIEFIESFCDSGAFRFQQFRQQKVLAIGEGDMLLGMVSALLGSGLPTLQAVLTESKTSRHRVMEIEAAAKKTDPEVSIEIVSRNDQDPSSWKEWIKPFDAILYGSQEGDLQELRSIIQACKEQKKLLIPAIFHGETGVAGPITSPDTNENFESAWQSLKLNERNKEQTDFYSPPASVMLANVIVFELFKKITGVPLSSHNQMFLLNLETLEGKWHPFKPHPLVTGKIKVKKLENVFHEMNKRIETKDQDELLYYFSELTLSQLGIFQCWEEDDLPQLPLSQCEIQSVNIKPHGSSPQHPSVVCAALTHGEARRKAGLTGIEQYLSPLKNEILSALTQIEECHDTQAALHIGAGETSVEGLSRALQKTIEDQWSEKADPSNKNIAKLALTKVEDDFCRYCLTVLTTMNKVPELGLGKDTYGFPVVWMKAENNHWYGHVGFTLTLALREALLQAVMETQNKTSPQNHKAPSFSTIQFEDKAIRSTAIPSSESHDQTEVLRSAVNQLQNQQQELSFVKIGLETFEKDGLVNIYGVFLEKGETK